MLPTIYAVNQGAIDRPQLAGDVGFDLHLMEQVTILPGRVVKAPIGDPDAGPLRIALPDGHWGSIFPRSSLVDAGLTTIGTVIDPGYRGQIFVFILNLSNRLVDLHPGLRVAQLVVFPSIVPRLVAVAVLPPSERGEQGFGSTGINIGRASFNNI